MTDNESADFFPHCAPSAFAASGRAIRVVWLRAGLKSGTRAAATICVAGTDGAAIGAGTAAENIGRTRSLSPVRPPRGAVPARLAPMRPVSAPALSDCGPEATQPAHAHPGL